jgi:hypothetical protein
LERNENAQKGALQKPKEPSQIIDLGVGHPRGLLVTLALLPSHDFFLLLDKTAAWAAARTEEIHTDASFDSELIANFSSF